jgi:hypothetical protein
MSALVSALSRRESDYRSALKRLPEAEEEVRHDAREAIELIGCLRRLLPSCTLEQIHKAFGAPGDFGYESVIGDALSRFYRGQP